MQVSRPDRVRWATAARADRIPAAHWRGWPRCRHDPQAHPRVHARRVRAAAGLGTPVVVECPAPERKRFLVEKPVSDRLDTNSAENHVAYSQTPCPAHARSGSQADRSRRLAPWRRSSERTQGRSSQCTAGAQATPSGSRDAADTRRCPADRARMADEDDPRRDPGLAQVRVSNYRVQRPLQPHPPARRGRGYGRALARHAGVCRPPRAPSESHPEAHWQVVRDALPRARSHHPARRSQHAALRAPQSQASRFAHALRSLLDRSALERTLFDGWADPIRGAFWKIELAAQPPPTRRASTWLLTTGWRRRGLLRFDEAPA